jgi:hypothetical protein
VDRALWQLEQHDLVHLERAVPEEVYSFEHVFTRDSVYKSLLKRRRADLHLAVGRAIEELYADRIEEQLEQLAYHYDRTEDAGRAAVFLYRAGEKSRRAYLNEAALEAFQRALARLDAAGDVADVREIRAASTSPRRRAGSSTARRRPRLYELRAGGPRTGRAARAREDPEENRGTRQVPVAEGRGAAASSGLSRNSARGPRPIRSGTRSGRRSSSVGSWSCTSPRLPKPWPCRSKARVGRGDAWHALQRARFFTARALGLRRERIWPRPRTLDTPAEGSSPRGEEERQRCSTPVRLRVLAALGGPPRGGRERLSEIRPRSTEWDTRQSRRDAWRTWR